MQLCIVGFFEKPHMWIAGGRTRLELLMMTRDGFMLLAMNFMGGQDDAADGWMVISRILGLENHNGRQFTGRYFPRIL